jgi:hypothetical protein
MSLQRIFSPLILLVVFSLPAHADVYKYYDSNGNLVLSDTLPKDHVDKAEKIEARPVMTIPAMKVNRHNAEAEGKPDKKAAAKAYVIVIQSPGAEANYPRLGDAIPVAVSVSPSLADGQKLEFSLDGVATSSSSLNPVDFSRGGHTFEVKVVDATGKVLASSAATFYLQQHTK